MVSATSAQPRFARRSIFRGMVPHAFEAEDDGLDIRSQSRRSGADFCPISMSIRGHIGGWQFLGRGQAGSPQTHSQRNAGTHSGVAALVDTCDDLHRQGILGVMRHFRISPEFGAGPLWDDAWDGKAEICPHPTSLGLSTALSDDLLLWQSDYEATLDAAHPSGSAFATAADRVAWERRGYELEARGRHELGETGTVRLDLPG